MSERVADDSAESSVPKFSVIIPCYNEKEMIMLTVTDVCNCLNRYTASYQLVLVDDGSTDGSDTQLTELTNRYQCIELIRHEANLGYGAALKSGIRRARNELVAVIDADGTYPVDSLPAMIEQMDGADMVVGARIGDNVHRPVMRRTAKTILAWYTSWIANRKIPDINSGMRVFRKSLAEKFFHILPDGFSFTTTITLAFLTNRYQVRYVPIDYRKRVGSSKIQPIRDTLRFAQLIVRTGVYFAPLRVLFPLIVVLNISFLASAIYDVFVLDNLTDKTVILLFFAVNTLMFALLADMIDKRSAR